MVSEAHCMSFPCTEPLLFNYAKVKTVFLFHGTFKINQVFYHIFPGLFWSPGLSVGSSSMYVLIYTKEVSVLEKRLNTNIWLTDMPGSPFPPGFPYNLSGIVLSSVQVSFSWNSSYLHISLGLGLNLVCGTGG